MITRITSQIRQVLPPSSALTLMMFAFGCLEISWIVFARSQGAQSVADRALIVRDHAIVVLMVAYAVFRVVAYHPLCRPDYMKWLKTTPWRRGLPLPLGPVSPAWPDVLIVGCAAALLSDPRQPFNPLVVRPSALSAVLACILTHAATTAFLVLLTRPRGPAYGSLFLLALALQLLKLQPLAAASALLAGWLIALAGLSRSWQYFPWDETIDIGLRLKGRWKSMQSQNAGLVDTQTSPDRVPPAELGWPFSALSPWVAPQSVSRGERLLGFALLGFWMRAIFVQIPDRNFVMGIGSLIVGYGTFMAAIVRLGLFGSHHTWPISFWGRVVTFRWVIRKYDRMLIPPVALIAVVVATGLCGHFLLHLPPATLFPVMTVAGLWSFTLIGPDPHEWKLTAPSRIVPGRLNRRNYDQLS